MWPNDTTPAINASRPTVSDVVHLIHRSFCVPTADHRASAREISVENVRPHVVPGRDAPALILTLLLAIAAGRIAQAHQAVEAAARDAARQASIARDPTTARTAALTSAQASLTREGLHCRPEVTVNTSDFARPVGQPATVTTYVTCTVQLADIAAAGIPTTTVTAVFASPLDPYRGR